MEKERSKKGARRKWKEQGCRKRGATKDTTETLQTHEGKNGGKNRARPALQMMNAARTPPNDNPKL